jgi:hypothetical protein
MVDKLVSLHSGEKHRLIDMGDQTHAEQVVAHPPFDLLTDGGDGPNRRLRVDVGQTGFFGGREFRTFKELNVAASTTYVIKAVVPINLILFGLTVSAETGHLRLATVVGGTEGGSFSETLPIFGRNNMSERPTPFYTPVVVLTAGGTHTGGTEIDVLRLKTNNNQNQSSTVTGEGGDERGVAAGTYYFRLQNLSATDAIVGVFSARWEERLP